MNYELAKELKEAGFPQEGVEGETRLSGNAFGSGLEYCYHPDLSELIEACGQRFDEVRPLRMAGQISSWQALGVDENLYHSNHGNGSTPEEAVARLWLALNKKEK